MIAPIRKGDRVTCSFMFALTSRESSSLVFGRNRRGPPTVFRRSMSSTCSGEEEDLRRRCVNRLEGWRGGGRGRDEEISHLISRQWCRLLNELLQYVDRELLLSYLPLESPNQATPLVFLLAGLQTPNLSL